MVKSNLLNPSVYKLRSNYDDLKYANLQTKKSIDKLKLQLKLSQNELSIEKKKDKEDSRQKTTYQKHPSLDFLPHKYYFDEEVVNSLAINYIKELNEQLHSTHKTLLGYRHHLADAQEDMLRLRKRLDSKQVDLQKLCDYIHNRKLKINTLKKEIEQRRELKESIDLEYMKTLENDELEHSIELEEMKNLDKIRQEALIMAQRNSRLSLLKKEYVINKLLLIETVLNSSNQPTREICIDEHIDDDYNDENKSSPISNKHVCLSSNHYHTLCEIFEGLVSLNSHDYVEEYKRLDTLISGESNVNIITEDIVHGNSIEESIDINHNISPIDKTNRYIQDEIPRWSTTVDDDNTQYDNIKILLFKIFDFIKQTVGYFLREIFLINPRDFIKHIESIGSVNGFIQEEYHFNLKKKSNILTSIDLCFQKQSNKTNILTSKQVLEHFHEILFYEKVHQEDTSIEFFSQLLNIIESYFLNFYSILQAVASDLKSTRCLLTQTYREQVPHLFHKKHIKYPNQNGENMSPVLKIEEINDDAMSEDEDGDLFASQREMLRSTR